MTAQHNSDDHRNYMLQFTPPVGTAFAWLPTGSHVISAGHVSKGRRFCDVKPFLWQLCADTPINSNLCSVWAHGLVRLAKHGDVSFMLVEF